MAFKYVNLEALTEAITKIKEWVTTNFVNKENGKGLSTNDYTTADKTKLSGLINYTHPKSGVTAGTYRSVTADANGHITAGSNPTTLGGYGITDAASKTHRHASADIDSVQASSIQGVISLSNLPSGALERMVIVADDIARLKLTTSQVQQGDTVKVTATGLMYFVVDDTKLTTEEGYSVYTAGSASSVPWSGIVSKPSTFPPATHSHTLDALGAMGKSDMVAMTIAEVDALF